MFNLIARGLAVLYDLPVVGGSYGIAIILLTLVVMVLLMPLTYKATKSTIKMQEVQPKLKALQQKYKDDRQTLHQELAALYQENGINPVGGCLPMLAQLPVFLVLFNVLRGLSRRVEETPYFTIAERARQMVNAEPVNGRTFDPQYLSPDSAMYVDLSATDQMKFWIFDLAEHAIDVVRSDFILGLAYVVLILFVVATSYYQQRQISARRKNQDQPSSPMNSQQEMIMKFLPILTGVWSFVFPTGLVVYWATSNVFRIGQQAYITRSLYGEDDNPSGGAGAASAALVDKVDNDADADSGASTAAAKGTNGVKNTNKGSGGGKSGKRTDADGDRDETAHASTNGAGEANGEMSTASVSGRSGSNGTTANRSQQWERRRSQKQRTRQRNETRQKEQQSTRTTPKGTLPSGTKKKRKR